MVLHTTRTKEILSEIQAMTLEEIEERLPIVEAEAVDIAAQIRKVEASKKDGTGSAEGRTNEWWARAMNSLKLKRFMIAQMQQRRKALRQDINWIQGGK